MVYGSPADVKVVEKYVSREEFRKALGDAPAGIFTLDQLARETRYTANSAIAAAPVSRR